MTSNEKDEIYEILHDFAPLKYFYPWSGPMPVVYAAGEPYEMGYQEGVQAKAIDPNMVKWFADSEQERWGWKKCMKKYNLTRTEIIEHMKELWDEVIKRDLGEEIANDFFNEMKGFADGYGNPHVDIWDVMMINVGYTLCDGFPSWLDWKLNLKPKSSLEVFGDGCSAFAAWGKATNNGRIIVAHNDDGWSYPLWFMYLLVAAPEKGHSFAGAVWPGALMYRPAMNDAGLWISSNSCEQSKEQPKKFQLPVFSIRDRWIIQYSDDVNSAFKKYKGQMACWRSIIGSVMIADPIQVIAFSGANDYHYAVWSHLDDYIVQTNHVVPERLHSRLIPRQYEASVWRYDALCKLISSSYYGDIDEKVAAQIMGSHFDIKAGTINQIPQNVGICRHVHNHPHGNTADTHIAIPEDRILYVSMGSPCTATWVKVRIGSKEEITDKAKKATK